MYEKDFKLHEKLVLLGRNVRPSFTIKDINAPETESPSLNMSRRNSVSFGGTLVLGNLGLGRRAS